MYIIVKFSKWVASTKLLISLECTNPVLHLTPSLSSKEVSTKIYRADVSQYTSHSIQSSKEVSTKIYRVDVSQYTSHSIHYPSNTGMRGFRSPDPLRFVRDWVLCYKEPTRMFRMLCGCLMGRRGIPRSKITRFFTI